MGGVGGGGGADFYSTENNCAIPPARPSLCFTQTRNREPSVTFIIIFLIHLHRVICTLLQKIGYVLIYWPLGILWKKMVYCSNIFSFHCEGMLAKSVVGIIMSNQTEHEYYRRLQKTFRMKFPGHKTV